MSTTVYVIPNKTCSPAKENVCISVNCDFNSASAQLKCVVTMSQGDSETSGDWSKV